MYVVSPILFIVGVLIGSVVIVFFKQTNDSYKRFSVLLIMLFATSIVLGIMAFMNASATFFGFSSVIQSLICGCLKLFIFEFMTEIVFPVSPVLGLGILNAVSGILSLFVSMLADDTVKKDPLNRSFVYVVQLVCLIFCVVCLYYFATSPYKLNRTDFDFNRRATMINPMAKMMDKHATREEPLKKTVPVNTAGEFNATSINRLIESHNEEGV